MKSFLKYVLATFVGIILTSVIMFFIFFGIINALISSKENSVKVEKGTVLSLKLDQPIIDRKPNIPFDFSTFSKNQKMGLNTIIDCIKKAKDDKNIAGIHLELSYIPAGMATIEEIRNALLDFKKSGKFVTAYSETYTQLAYYLATVADEIYFNPTGFFFFVGMRAQSPFFSNTLKKLDIDVIVVKHGIYKGATEPFTEDGYTPANRKQLNKLIHSIWDDVCENISEQRGISVDRLNEIADKLLLKDANSAYSLGFIDSLIYTDQMIAILKQKTGTEESKDLKTITLSKYSAVPKEKEYKGLAKDKIAVIYAGGEITSGDGDDDNIGSDKFGKAIRDARKDSSIKAIVIRINSPGGSGLASEVIWRELALARESKPLIVSMGNLAASGGYYIACLADTILAQPNTLTGSIGVFAMLLNTEEMFKKIGITFDTEKTNDNADFLSGIRPLHPVEMEFLQWTVDSFYTKFLKRVSDGRHMSADEVDKIGQGRIWSGLDALEIGLVDKLGGLDDAIEIARNMAGLSEKYRIVDLPVQEDPFQKLIKDLTEGAKIKALTHELGIQGDYVNAIKNMITNQGIMTRMPYDIELY